MYKVRLAKNKSEVLQSMYLVKKYFLQYYRTYPIELPDLFVIVEDMQENKIISAMGFEYKLNKKDKLLEAEKYFEFSFDMVFPDAYEKGVSELGRWVSTNNYVTIYLILAAFKLAYNLDIEYTSSFQKEQIANWVITKYKLPVKWIKVNVKEDVRKGKYKEYFGANDLVIFVQKVKPLIDWIESYFGYRNDIEIDIPQEKSTILTYKIANYGITEFS